MSAAQTSQAFSIGLTDTRPLEDGRRSDVDGRTDRGRAPSGGTATPDDGRRVAHPTTAVVVAIGVVLTIALVAATWTGHDHNEQRLLRQQVHQAAQVLKAFVPSVQSPLASAAETVEVSDGADSQVFRQLMTPLVQPEGQYASASLWRVDDDALQPAVVIGKAPKLASQPPDVIRAFLQRSAATKKFAVIGVLDGDAPSLGYASASARTPPRFVAYVESALPPNRTSVVRRDSAFRDVASAIYLGNTETPSALLTATTPHLPLDGRRASEAVEFGDSSLLLVMSPSTELGGRLLFLLPWIVGALGLLATLGTATLTERLLRRRDQAEQLARDNAHLYASQRSVAETLQRSLLPERLPHMPGVDLAFRYLPGASGVDIGGDWYDVIPLDDTSLMIVVGDVSGRGVRAGVVMASLRFAIRAFASEGDSPSVVLAKLNGLVDVDHDDHFATVLCAVADVAEHTVVVANAGHPKPLLLQDDVVRFVDTPVGVPIGVTRTAVYEAVSVSVAPQATLLAFTDGLFERRGETIDDGLERLRRATRGERSLEVLLSEIVPTQASDGVHDDVAILGVRWLQ
jgi:hypothetical protein